MMIDIHSLDILIWVIISFFIVRKFHRMTFSILQIFGLMCILTFYWFALLYEYDIHFYEIFSEFRIPNFNIKL